MLAFLLGFAAQVAPVVEEPAPDEGALAPAEAPSTPSAPSTESAPSSPSAAPPAPPAPTVTTPPQREDECTLAVLDLEPGERMPKERALALSDIITSEVGALSGCSVLSRSDIRGVLSFEAEKQLLGCSSDSSCLSELAGALGADLLVTGTVSKIEGSMLLSLRMTDLKALKVVRRATDTFAGGDDEAIPFVAWLARKLITDDPAKLGEKPIARPKQNVVEKPPEPKGTVWGTLAWTGVVVSSVAVVITGGLAGTTYGISEYMKALKTNNDFVDPQQVAEVNDYGTLAADATNVGIYVTAGLVAATVPFFFLPHEEEP